MLVPEGVDPDVGEYSDNTVRFTIPTTPEIMSSLSDSEWLAVHFNRAPIVLIYVLHGVICVARCVQCKCTTPLVATHSRKQLLDLPLVALQNFRYASSRF